MTTQTTIDSMWTINEVIAAYPDAIAVFNAFGMDMCCGADESIVMSASESGVDLGTVMSALLNVAAESKPK